MWFKHESNEISFVVLKIHCLRLQLYSTQSSALSSGTFVLISKYGTANSGSSPIGMSSKLRPIAYGCGLESQPTFCLDIVDFTEEEPSGVVAYAMGQLAGGWEVRVLEGDSEILILIELYVDTIERP